MLYFCDRHKSNAFFSSIVLIRVLLLQKLAYQHEERIMQHKEKMAIISLAREQPQLFGRTTDCMRTRPLPQIGYEREFSSEDEEDDKGMRSSSFRRSIKYWAGRISDIVTHYSSIGRHERCKLQHISLLLFKLHN